MDNLRAIQVNLWGGKTALDLLQQMAREREEDILFIIEQYKNQRHGIRINPIELRYGSASLI